jgi:YD repeat-containing protein
LRVVAERTLAVIDALGYVRTHGYDLVGRETWVMDSLGHVSSTVWNPRGLAVARIDALGHAVTTEYDRRRLPVARQDPLGHLTTTTFDGLRHAVAVKDALGRVTTSVFDPVGRTVGRSQAQADALLRDIEDATDRGADDIRVNQEQVDAFGRHVGIDRPDLQYTVEEHGRPVRYCIEYDSPSSPRGPAHRDRILNNDPFAKVILRRAP